MILVNGQPDSRIDVADRGLHYGDGLFETIAVAYGRPQLWQAHMARLLEGCRRLAIPQPDPVQLADEAKQLCGDADKAVLKIIVTRGTGGRGYRAEEGAESTRILMRYPWPELAQDSAPYRLRLCSTPLACNPALAEIKHLNRLEQVIARGEWDDESIHEGVMCDPDGNVIEGISSNLFVVRKGKLLTSDVSRCGVAGVMRGTVLALADELGIASEIATIHRDEMAQMDELFVTNSIIGIRPVALFETTAYTGNAITNNLQSALRQQLERDA